MGLAEYAVLAQVHQVSGGADGKAVPTSGCRAGGM
jgi:hypothetical protein